MPKAQQQGPKLRTSCNNCLSAKVGCKKKPNASADSPACVRCTRQNIECVYAISKRRGRPFQPYPKSESDLAPNMGHGEGQHDIDTNSNSNGNNENSNTARTVHNNDIQQDASNSYTSNERPTIKDSAYPWPKTGWNLSDVGPEIDFSSVSLNAIDEFRMILPQKHDMCSVMSNLGLHLAKLDESLNTTCDDRISKLVAERYQMEFCTIRATITQWLYCKCHTCCYDSTMTFLLATLSSSLIGSYRRIAMNLLMNLPGSKEDGNTFDDLVPLASLLKLEMDHFRDICRVIRAKSSNDPKAETVGKAFHDMLCGEVKDVSYQLDHFLRSSK